MPQTSIALLALAASVLISVNRHKVGVDDQFRMISDEVEMVMLNVATNHLEKVGAMAYDERLLGNNRATRTSELTPPNQLRLEAGDYNDVDDFNASNVVDSVLIGGSNLKFRIRTTVTYVEESNTSQVKTDAPSKFKRVTTTLESITYPMPSPVSLESVVACGAACPW